MLAGILEQRLAALAQEFNMNRAVGVENLLTMSTQLPLEVDFMEAQNLFFHLMEEHYAKGIASRRVQPDLRAFVGVLLRIAAKLGFNPGRYERLLLGV
jgi:hypothetical protein